MLKMVEEKKLFVFLFIISLVCVGAQDLTGNWTGFTNGGTNPLFDWYSIIYDNTTGAITVTCMTSCGWTSGTGQVSGNQIKIELNTNGALVGTIVFNSSTMCGWTDAPNSGCPFPPPFTPSCTVIIWENKTTWVLLQPIDTVHVIFMNHLDVGYNGIPLTGFINNILNIYFHEYYPRAITVANTMASLNLTQTLVYTTHPWLVSLFLDCPPNFVLAGIKLKCPSAEEVSDMEVAIKQGIITWHRGPFNLQPENMDASLFEYSISIAADLDERFGFAPKKTLSQRDVPGLTRAVVPLLARNNASAVSIGVNPFSCPPATTKAFLWQDIESATQIIALWHSGGYPNNPGPSPSNAGGLSRGDCVTIRGFRQALCWAFRTDNSGPPEDIGEVLSYFDLVAAQFPGANVIASTFDNFIEALLPVAKQVLPVYTQEIGDVWIQGISSDPYKMAQFRTITRERAICIETGVCNINDPVLKNMSRWLIKPPEHTWGLPSVGDGQLNLWSNEQFEASRNQQIYINCEDAWIEQREFNQMAVDTLVQANHPLAKSVIAALELIEPSRPSTSGYTQTSPGTQFTCNGAQIAFDKTGAISTFNDPSGTSWASASNPLAKLVYSTFDESGFNASLGCNGVFGGKPNSNSAHPQTADWFTSVVSMWQQNSCNFLVQVALPNETVVNYGGYPEAWITYNVTVVNGNVVIDVDYQWFKKTSTRLAESFMLNFTPVQKQNYAWSMDKLGTRVSPYDVMQGGNQNQHAVWDGVTYFPSNGASGKAMRIWSMDVPSVSPITTTVDATPLVNSVNPLSGDMLGFGFNLYNNIWNTNYIFWYPLLTVEGADERLRFQVVVS